LIVALRECSSQMTLVSISLIRLVRRSTLWSSGSPTEKTFWLGWSKPSLWTLCRSRLSGQIPSPGELDEVAAQARALREWFRGFVLVHMGRPLTAKAQKLLEPLNRLLERDEGYGAIMPRSARPHNHRAPSGGTRVPCSPALESTQLNTSANRPGHGAPRLLGRFLFGERMRR
jgi:hypothetical protein